MRVNEFGLVLTLIAMLFLGCKSKSPKGSSMKQQIGDMIYSVHKVESPDSISNRYQTYVFRISDAKGNGNLIRRSSRSQDDYMGKLQYVNFGIVQDFEMIAEGDTASAIDCHYADNFNLAPHLDFTVTFTKKANSGAQSYIFYHDRLFNAGTVKIELE